MAQSILHTAKNTVEIVARFDDDDEQSAQAASLYAKVIIGPRIRNMTVYWNECFDACRGDIVQQGNDDTIYTSPGWDVLVEEVFEEVPDKIILVHGFDVYGHGDRFGPHSFVHRKWVQTLGYFIAPYYSSDFGDAHLVELADRIGRRRYVPFNIEHRHFSHGFDEMNDEVTQERLQRHREDDPDTLYYSSEKSEERRRDAEKLAKLMDAGQPTTNWVPPKGTPGVLSMGKCPRCGSVMTVPAFEKGVNHCNGCALEWKRPTK